MAFALVPDELWQEIEPLLPRKRRSRKGGRPPSEARACLSGIVFVLRTGCPWNLLPVELSGVSGVTCWRYLRDWTKAGVWRDVHQRLLNRLGRLDDVVRMIHDDKAADRVIANASVTDVSAEEWNKLMSAEGGEAASSPKKTKKKTSKTTAAAGGKKKTTSNK